MIAANGVAGWNLQKLQVGDEVTLSLNIQPNVGEIVQAVGGGPRLLRDGAVSIETRDERFHDSFTVRRHPRTGLGLKGNELLIVTVDGRQPGYSEGMTLPEFARFLLSRGCTDAMNLDGGGSTAMVVRGKIVNSPSDGTERKVADALALFSLAPPLRPGDPPRPSTRLLLDPPESILLAGDAVSFHASGLDEYCEPTPVDASGFRWEASEGLGTVAADGTFTAGPVTQATTGQVTAHYGNLSVSAAVSVLPAPARLTLNPVQAILAPGSRQQFTVRAFDPQGDPVELSPGRVIWSCATSPPALGPAGCSPRRSSTEPTS